MTGAQSIKMRSGRSPCCKPTDFGHGSSEGLVSDNRNESYNDRTATWGLEMRTVRCDGVYTGTVACNATTSVHGAMCHESIRAARFPLLGRLWCHGLRALKSIGHATAAMAIASLLAGSCDCCHGASIETFLTWGTPYRTHMRSDAGE